MKTKETKRQKVSVRSFKDRTDISVQYLLDGRTVTETVLGRNGFRPKHEVIGDSPVEGLSPKGVLLVKGHSSRRTDIYLSSESSIGDMLPDELITVKEALELLPPIAKKTLCAEWNGEIIIGVYSLRRKLIAESIEGDTNNTVWYYEAIDLLGQSLHPVTNLLRAGDYDYDAGRYSVSVVGVPYGPDGDGIRFRGWWYGPEFLNTLSEELREEYDNGCRHLEGLL